MPGGGKNFLAYRYHPITDSMILVERTVVEWSSAPGIVQGALVSRYLSNMYFESRPGKNNNLLSQNYRSNIIGLLFRRVIYM